MANTTEKKRKPNAHQILGAKIRAAEEAFVKKHRRKYGGGWEIPSREDTYAYLSKLFGLPPHEISYFFTYSCYCDHPWSAGACPDCPD